MNQPLLISNSQARRLLLERQGLCASPLEKLTTDALLAMIKALGFVQVDSINTVARAHHMILFSRNQTYRQQQLTHLLESERSLFEHWTHDAAVIPTEFYPYWRHRFQRDRTKLLTRWRKSRRKGFEKVFDEILDHVVREGSTMAREIGSGKKSGSGWWDWHPEKTALEFHWRTGNLAIAGRRGFQKIYDTTENVIPYRYRRKTVSESTFIDWACRSALTRLGIATPAEIADFWNLVTRQEAIAWCNKQLGKENLIDVLVASADNSRSAKALALADLPDQLADLPDPPDRLRILSPFDPLIRDRKRCLRLFGFDYRIEVFVPKEKRQYGYYVFPILEGDRFVGRIDVKNEKDDLIVTGLWMEPGVKMGKGRKSALDAELHRHRRFVGARTLRFEL